MNAREQTSWTRTRLGRCGPRVDLLTACFDRHEYAPHAHDEFTVGVTTGGLEAIAYRGGRIVSGPGTIVVLEPGEMHTGGPAAPEGYAYRALYAAPALLTDGTHGTGLPHFREPVLDDPELAGALRRAHTEVSACPDPLEAESRLPWLLTALAHRHSTARAHACAVPGAGTSPWPSATVSPTNCSPRPPSPPSPPTWVCPATSCCAPSVRRWGYRPTPGSPSTGSPGPAACWRPGCAPPKWPGSWASPTRPT